MASNCNDDAAAAAAANMLPRIRIKSEPNLARCIKNKRCNTFGQKILAAGDEEIKKG